MRGLVFSEYAKIVLAVISFGIVLAFLTIHFPKYAQKYSCYAYIKTTLDPSSLPEQCKFLYYSAKNYTIVTDDVNESVKEIVGLLADCWVESERGTLSHDILCYLVRVEGSVVINRSWIIYNVSKLTDIPSGNLEVKPAWIKQGDIALIIYNGSDSKIILW